MEWRLLVFLEFHRIKKLFDKFGSFPTFEIKKRKCSPQNPSLAVLQSCQENIETQCGSPLTGWVNTEAKNYTEMHISTEIFRDLFIFTEIYSSDLQNNPPPGTQLSWRSWRLVRPWQTTSRQVKCSSSKGSGLWNKYPWNSFFLPFTLGMTSEEKKVSIFWTLSKKGGGVSTGIQKLWGIFFFWRHP